jgi:hypothetical protein
VIRAVALASALVLAASMAAAQLRGRGVQPALVMPEGGLDGAFAFCRIAFRNSPYGDGAGWFVDYPRADLNLSIRFSELTTALISRDRRGDPNHIVVRLTDPQLFHCPFVMLTEPGGAYFDDQEAAHLKDYLLKGGFLWADDFWGNRAWTNWSDQIGKALLPSRYRILDLPLDHVLFHMLYDMRRIPQIPSIGFWFGTGGRTSERGPESAEPHVRAIFDERGRIMVVMTHNTDFGDAFEREGDNYSYFLQFAPEGYAFGINTLIYALTH